MPNPPSQRSVKIGADERGGWSSDRPRPGGGPARPADISTRCRVLSPSDRMRYSPGSVVIIIAPAAGDADRFAERLIEERGALLSLDKVRGLLAGRVDAEQVEERAKELLLAAARKRMEAGETVVIVTETLDPAEREPFLRAATSVRRPRHAILLDAGAAQMGDEDRTALNELRRALDSGELGAEGFQTALRLNTAAASELKKILFRPPPRDDD
jgi:predicted kinase